MSVRVVLIGLMLILVAVTSLLVGALSIVTIDTSVKRDAQVRVNHVLDTVDAYYQKKSSVASLQLARVADELAEVPDRELEASRLASYRGELEFDVLGVRLSRHPTGVETPAGIQMLLERAFEGRRSWGTVLLDISEVEAEGGDSLVERLAVLDRTGSRPDLEDAALFTWFSTPILDADDAIRGVLYGGRSLNLDFDLVDEMRDLTFGSETHEGVPIGTVTIFLDDFRVATNVRTETGERAVGTRVSDEVRRRVLGDRMRWQDRALVVGNWYLSAYEPIMDPMGDVIGMLYVGLLEGPYDAIRAQLIWRNIGVMVVIVGLATVVAVLLIGRITAPLRVVSDAATAMARGESVARLEVRRGYTEIDALASSFKTMQDAIERRDRSLNERNQALSDANDRMKQDLDAAAKMQRELLPSPKSDGGSWSFAWYFQPCDELGGDLFNVIPLDAGQVAMFLLDVSGHGVPAAMLSVTLSRLMSKDAAGLGEAPESPTSVAAALNGRFPMESMHGRFFTLVYAVFDERDMTLRYTLAGHPPPILLRPGSPARLLTGRGFPIGVTVDATFDLYETRLRPGDLVVFYSDGITEARRSDGEMLGFDGFLSLLERARETLDEGIADGCARELDRWRDGEPFGDDLSVLVFEVGPGSGGDGSSSPS